MSLIATGATGHLGRLVVEHLLERGVPAEEIVATGRALDRIADLADRGVTTATLDYEDPATIDATLEEGDTLLLISSSDVGRAGRTAPQRRRGGGSCRGRSARLHQRARRGRHAVGAGAGPRGDGARHP